MSEHNPPTHKIVYLLMGFQVETTIEGKADALKTLLQRIQEIGGQPANLAPAGGTKPNGGVAPKCPRHKSPMRKGKRGWFCPRRMDDGDYCPESA